jgi:hypothetical protein
MFIKIDVAGYAAVSAINNVSGFEPSCKSSVIFLSMLPPSPHEELKSTLQQAAGNVLPCGSASHLGKDFIYLIRSLTPQQSAMGNALAIAVQVSEFYSHPYQGK